MAAWKNYTRKNFLGRVARHAAAMAMKMAAATISISHVLYLSTWFFFKCSVLVKWAFPIRECKFSAGLPPSDGTYGERPSCGPRSISLFEFQFSMVEMNCCITLGDRPNERIVLSNGDCNKTVLEMKTHLLQCTKWFVLRNLLTSFLRAEYRDLLKGLYVVARSLSLLLLTCSAWPYLGLAQQDFHTF